jgi:phage/plasmid-like protein (TIGR03299 family)
MPANIYSYVGREAAWHKLGTVTGRHMTWAEVQANGGLDYVVFKSQLHDGLGRPVNAWGTFRWNRTDKLAGNREAAVFLGVVGEEYNVIQHAEGFRMIDALVASVDNAHYETAGALGNGERVWGLADLNLAVSVGADKQVGYLLFCTGHDGSLSHQYRIVLTRVVCQNTLTAALSEKTRAKLTIRHTKNAGAKLDGIHEALTSLRGDMLTVEEKLNFLATRRVTREAVESVFHRLFPKTKAEDGAEKESCTRRKNVLADILTMYESNDNNAFPEQRGTAYNLLNSIVEYADHSRSSRGGNGNGRAESALFGSGERLKAQALDVILETANGLPVMSPAPVYRLPAALETGSRGLLDQILTESAS